MNPLLTFACLADFALADGTTRAAWMLDHVTHRDPYPTITAPTPALRTYTAQADDNRTAYFEQSAATRGGKVAPFKPL